MGEFVAVTLRKPCDSWGAEIVEKDGALFLHIRINATIQILTVRSENTYLPIIEVLSTTIAKEHDDGTSTTISICEVESASEFREEAVKVTGKSVGFVDKLSSHFTIEPSKLDEEVARFKAMLRM